MLKTINLKKVYPNGEEALKGINLEIPNGQVVALIGPSGAGKSTFIRTINRLVEPTSGKVYFANEKNDITSLNKSKLRKIRRQIGMIFQEFALVERLSVMENVLSGRLGYVGFWNSFFRKFPQKDIEEAFRLLQRIGLELAAIINIHDVFLAQNFAERIIGLKAGEIVYDGKPSGLSETILTKIYGEEDWSKTVAN